MHPENLPPTKKDGEQQRGLLPKTTPPVSSSSSSVLSSTATLASTAKEPHDALFRAFNIWIIYKNILDRVSLADKTALALTCRRLRQSFPDAADVRTLRKRLSRPDFLDVLRVVAYDLPDHYVCEQCLYLHRDARTAQRKAKSGTMSEKWEWDLITGHAADTAVVQKASEGLAVGRVPPELDFDSQPMPELEPPCRLSGSTLNATTSPTASSTPPYDAGLLGCTFASRLSSTRRTPLAGLAHRDVQLLLKRVRLLRLRLTKTVPSPAPDPDPAPDPAPDSVLDSAPGWLSWWSRFWKRSKITTAWRGRDRDRDLNILNNLDMEEAVRVALRPFEVRREIVVSEIVPGIRFPIPAPKYNFVPRVILVSEPGGGGGSVRRAHFFLQTVLSFHSGGFYSAPLSICPHQVLNNNNCPVWRHANLNNSLFLQHEEELHEIGAGTGAGTRAGTRARNATRSALGGWMPTPEGVRNSRPSFRLHTAAECVVGKQYSHHDYHRICPQRPPDCRECAFEVQAENMEATQGEREAAAASARACALIRRLEDDKDKDRYVVSSSCDRCPTDFAVHIRINPADWTMGEELVITVWQDFGPEAPVTDEQWQSHIPGPFLQAELDHAAAPYTEYNTWRSGPSVGHAPGSVRALFENGEAALDI